MSQSWATKTAGAPGEDDGRGADGANKQTRNLLVCIAGNRVSWEHMGVHGARWQVNGEKASTIFGCDAGEEDRNRLERAIIHKITLLESNTNIDEVVAVHIDGLPPREFNQNGEGAAVFLVGEGRSTHPQEIFNISGNTEWGLAWMQQYPNHTSTNLQTEGVIFLKGSSFFFVAVDHPVVHMIQANPEQLGVQLILDTSLGGNYYKIDIQAFEFCANQIRENVLQNMLTTFNLSTLSVRIGKPDQTRWTLLTPAQLDALVPAAVRVASGPEALNEARAVAAQRYYDQPLFVTLRLRVEYTLPANNKTAEADDTKGVSAAPTR